MDKDKLREEGRRQGRSVARQVIQNMIDSKITLDREQVDVECGDLLCSVKSDDDSPFNPAKDSNPDWLTMSAAADAEIDVILDAVFVGEDKVSDLVLAQFRLDGYEQCKNARLQALQASARVIAVELDKCPSSIQEQIDGYVIPLLKKELEALGG